ncbi:hypothetical protein, partial [Caballeronia arvi]|uniref:hypothetical protein n=1 Tax=Caballeronia arvi TaxID=1777135 RepID=UPI001F2BE30E
VWPRTYVKTRHFYLAETRHFYLGPTYENALISIMSIVIGYPVMAAAGTGTGACVRHADRCGDRTRRPA